MRLYYGDRFTYERRKFSRISKNVTCRHYYRVFTCRCQECADCVAGSCWFGMVNADRFSKNGLYVWSNGAIPGRNNQCNFMKIAVPNFGQQIVY